MLHLIVDGANVVGSRPDGWWLDRVGAARRLAEQLAVALTEDASALAALGGPATSGVRVHLVLEGVAKRAKGLLLTDPQLVVVLAPAQGDAAIVELATELRGERVLVVTADRALRERVRAAGATTLGPRALLAVLPD